MTDFAPESSWTEPVVPMDDLTWGSTSVTREQLRAAVIQRRPAAALAANINELLESMARKRVPRLDAVRARLQEARAGGPLVEVEDALLTLHAATSAVDFLAGRSGGERAEEFVRQGEALATAIRGLGPRLAEFLQREAVGAPVTRLVWIDLVIESSSLRKRVRQGAQWLVEMDQDLLQRRKTANTDVTLRAIEELARRSVAMHERLQAVHRLCTQARSVHTLSEKMAAERATLWAMVQDRVLPACTQLDEALQPLLHAAAYRALVPTELIGAIESSHVLQVDLTQAAAQIQRLRNGDAELAGELAQMQDKARLLTA
jgi:hypothetical protein